MLALNIKQEPQKIILDRFNALNSLQLKHDDFVFSDVEEHHDSRRNTNTRVLVSPAVVSPGYNSFYIYYNRMNFTDVFDRVNMQISSGGLDSLVEILDLINDELGIYLTAQDVEDTTIIYDDPDERNERATVEVIAKTDSYLFIGSHTLVLNVKNNPYDPGVRSAITGVSYIENGSRSDIVNVNTSYSKELYFKFLDGVVVKNDPIVKGIKLIDNSVYVFGEFDLDVPNTIPGSQGEDVYNGVKIDRVGRVVSVDKVAKFDNVFQTDVVFYPKPDGNKFYLADKRKYITNGNTVGLYRYNNNGDRDNSLITSNMSLVVDKILPLDSGFIVASEMQHSPRRVVKIQRYNENGSVNSEMPEIQIGDLLGIDIEVQSIIASYDDNLEVDGFYILLSNIFSQQIVPVLSGTKVYGNKHLNKNNHILPVLKFTLQGILDTTFNGNLQNAGKDFFKPEIGIFNFDRLFALPDGFIFFNKTRNPITGVFTLVGLRVYKDGRFRFLAGDEYFQLPIVKTVISIEQNMNSFLATVIVEELDSSDNVVEKSKIIGYDENGVYTGVYLNLEDSYVVKDTVLFKN